MKTDIIAPSRLLGFAALAVAPAAALAEEVEAPQSVEALKALSIEELAQVEVRSASKRPEPLSRAATALYVIGNQDIVNSAATSLPEVLRMAPNLQVQQLDAYQYAVTARGFNSLETSNKLLVLIDGRSVYTPLHSGVFWELYSPLLEDIQQVEVISGPGGTLFGPNAVNGVVSIVSLDSRETIGGLARLTAGPEQRTAALRHGFRLGEDAAVRVYGNWFDREDLPDGLGPDIDDAFSGWQAGFRADFGAAADHFTIRGDVFDSETDLLPGDGHRGHDLLARWTRRTGEAGSFQIQAYYDYFERRFTLVEDRLETFDVEAQYADTAGAHEFVVGGGVRTTRDEFINNLNSFQLDPSSRRLWVVNAFAQDRFAVSPELSLIAGLKAERSSFTGFHLLPNLRLAWQPGERTLLWGAVSRAVRTPSRIDRQLVSLPILAPATGFRSEKLIAFEAGYRGQPTERTSLSVSLFFNLYDDIRTTEFSPGGTLPIRLSNSLEGHTYGIEAWSQHQLASWWRLSLGAATIWKDFQLDPGHVDLAGLDSLGHDPDWQLLARSDLTLTDRLQLHAGLRILDGIDTDPRIGGYAEADLRLAYRLTDGLELYVAGTNLLHRDHAESNDAQRAQRPQRSLYAGTRVRF